MSLPPGTRLEHYEILSPLGKGGMGEVYRARDTKLGREVAIKTLPAGLSGGEHLARFKREARAASALNHPHICTIYDLCEHGDTPFIVMELLKGDVLSDLLVRGPLGLDHALGLGVQLAEALEAAHAEGIIHRDIKPANIFVTHRGDAKILDFGVARIQHAAGRRRPDRGGRFRHARRWRDSGPLPTCPPSRLAVNRSTPERTCSPLASCSTRW